MKTNEIPKGEMSFERVGDSWQWISYPEGIRYGWFNYVKAPVRDAGKLAAFSLDPEENKKFFLTVRLPDGTLPGNYEGTLKIHRAGRELGILKVALRVLPFELPDPRTWYDIGKKLFSSNKFYRNFSTECLPLLDILISIIFIFIY